MTREQALGNAYRAIIATTYHYSRRMVRFDTLRACRATSSLYQMTRQTEPTR